MRTLASFKDIHKGETIIVCGCGSSLNEFNHTGRFITIGVNDVGRRFHPDYLVILNPPNQFVDDRFHYVKTSGAQYLFTQLDLGPVQPSVVRFRLGKRGGTDFSDPNVLHYTQNSPYAALCLAVHMGASRIGLIGVDFTKNHFFGQTGTHPLARKFNTINQQYGQLAGALIGKGIKVFNLSRQSSLTAFPKIDIEKFINLKNDHLTGTQPVTQPVDIAPKRRQTMKIIIEQHTTSIIEDLMSTLAKTAERIGYPVKRKKLANMADSQPAIYVVWNGRKLRAVGPTIYCEHGWLPRWYYQMSFQGINADSHMAPFQWDGKSLTDKQVELLDKYFKMIREKGPAGHNYMQTEREAVHDLPGEFILVPLQIENDTNILRHVPIQFRKMQAFIDHISAGNPPYPVVFKQHPADQRRGNQHLYLRMRRKIDILRPHDNSNIHQILKSGRCIGIISLNSNVVHDGLIWDVPSIVLGKNVWPIEAGPFLTKIPKIEQDWKKFASYFSNEKIRKYRDAYAYYLMCNQWSLADARDEEKVEKILQTTVKKYTGIHCSTPALSIKPVGGKSLEINMAAINKGWLFEDIKQHFSKIKRENVKIVCSEHPRRGADAWIFLRTGEAAKTPDPASTIVHIHDLYDDGMYKLKGKRRIVAKCAGVVLTHPDQRTILEDNGIALEAKYILCRPLGPLKEFTPRKALPKCFSIGWVGRPVVHNGEDIKRVYWFVDAVKSLELPPGKFRVIFMGERLESYHQALINANIQSVYYPRSRWSISRYPQYYHELDCVVNTSTRESGPMSLFEAFASGVPVISTPMGWAKEWIHDGENGYLVKDVSGICKALHLLYKNRKDWFDKRFRIYETLQGYTMDSWMEQNLDLAVRILKQ